MQKVIKDVTTCPHCGITASGEPSIQSVFGFRNMGDGTIRSQSWCRECRVKSAQRVVA